ncbi:hypothetical protein QYF36_018426 [Acer negundo]|nr:hypothetical protein QYF36_018426 [Acer negundo]
MGMDISSSILNVMISAIRSWLNRFDQVVEFCPRNSNSFADTLAKNGSEPVFADCAAPGVSLASFVMALSY